MLFIYKHIDKCKRIQRAEMYCKSTQLPSSKQVKSTQQKKQYFLLMVFRKMNIQVLTNEISHTIHIYQDEFYFPHSVCMPLPLSKQTKRTNKLDLSVNLIYETPRTKHKGKA